MEKRFSSKRAQSKSIECANYDLFFCFEFDSLVPILCNSGVFLAKCPFLIKIHLSRLHKQRGNVHTSIQLEKNGLQSLLIGDGTSSKYQ